MTENRRFLSRLLGMVESVTRSAFRGVYTLHTLHTAPNLMNSNHQNIFIVDVGDNGYILIWLSANHSFVIDASSLATNIFPPEIVRFVNSMTDGAPIAILPYRLVQRDGSLLVSVAFAVSLCQGIRRIDSIIAKFGLTPNHVIRNKSLLADWFTNRYS